MADRTAYQAPEERSEDQAHHEAALREVEETMLNIDAALRRAERAVRELRRIGSSGHFVEAVEQAAGDLNRVRRTLTQASYFAREGRSGYAAQPALSDELEDQGQLRLGR